MLRATTLLCAAAVVFMVQPSSGAGNEQRWMPIAQALGKTGSEMPGGIYRVGLPRTDLQVTLDGVALKPGFALGSWVAFEPVGKDALVMGDLVLTGDEVEPVMRKLQEGGLEISALHNHLLRASPEPFYMHISGHGNAVTLAHAIHDALVFSKTPLVEASAAARTNALTATRGSGLRSVHGGI